MYASHSFAEYALPKVPGAVLAHCRGMYKAVQPRWGGYAGTVTDWFRLEEGRGKGEHETIYWIPNLRLGYRPSDVAMGMSHSTRLSSANLNILHHRGRRRRRLEGYGQHRCGKTLRVRTRSSVARFASEGHIPGGNCGCLPREEALVSGRLYYDAPNSSPRLLLLAFDGCVGRSGFIVGFLPCLVVTVSDAPAHMLLPR